MDELSRVFAAPVSRQFGDREIVFAQFTFAIYQPFERWAVAEHKRRRAERIKERLDALSERVEGLSPYDHGRLLLQVTEREPAFDLNAAMLTTEGTLRLLTTSAQVHDKKITEPVLAALLPMDQKFIVSLLDELTPTGPETADERRWELLRQARAKLEGMRPDSMMGSGAAVVADAVKLLYEAAGEEPPVAEGESPPADGEPDSVSSH